LNMLRKEILDFSLVENARAKILHITKCRLEVLMSQ